MMDALSGLELDGVDAGYGRKTILHGIALPRLSPGSMTALLGPNGAGKSTLLRGLAGLGTVEGQISLDGRDVRTMTAVDRSNAFGYLPQTLPPPVALTVFESVVATLRALPRSARSERSMESIARDAYSALEDVGITDLGERPLSQLSGGQRQLAGLAQIVARRPRVLLLDEPTSALDLRYQTRVMWQVRRLAKAQGLITVVVMHDITLAVRHADHVAVISNGELYGFGKPGEVVNSAMLRAVYGVEARVERCSQNHLQVIVDEES